MAIEHVKFAIAHTFSSGYFKLSSGFPPVIPYECSLEAVLTLSNATGDLQDCTGATCTMWGRPRDSQVAWLSLASGVVSGAGNNVITFTIPKDTLPEGWSLYPGKVMVKFIVEGAGVHQFVLYAEGLTIIGDQDDEDIEYPATEDIVQTVEEYAFADTPVALATKPGKRTIVLDATGGVIALTLPELGTYPGQRLRLVAIGTSNTTVAGEDVADTMNGIVSGAAGWPTPLVQWQSLEIVEYDSKWIALNPSISVP